MRKEILFAIILGVSLGLIVAFGVWRANGALKSVLTNAISSPTPSSAPTPINPSSKDITLASKDLKILSPENNDVLTSDTLKITGVTSPESYVIVDTINEDFITKSTIDGSFVLDVILNPGINSLTITSLSTDGKSSRQSLMLVYTTQIPPASDNSNKVGTDSVRAKVQEKLEQASNKAKAFFGTITDKTEISLMIKTTDGNIVQSAVTAATTYASLGKTQKDIEFTEVGIGDWIAAIGYKNPSGVLDTKRVLITSAPVDSQNAVMLGTVSKKNKKDFEFNSLLDGSMITFPQSSTTDLIKLENNQVSSLKFIDLAEKNKIVVIGKNTNNKWGAETIFVIASS